MVGRKGYATDRRRTIRHDEVVASSFKSGTVLQRLWVALGSGTWGLWISTQAFVHVGNKDRPPAYGASPPDISQQATQALAPSPSPSAPHACVKGPPSAQAPHACLVAQELALSLDGQPPSKLNAQLHQRPQSCYAVRPPSQHAEPGPVIGGAARALLGGDAHYVRQPESNGSEGGAAALPIRHAAHCLARLRVLGHSSGDGDRGLACAGGR